MSSGRGEDGGLREWWLHRLFIGPVIVQPGHGLGRTLTLSRQQRRDLPRVLIQPGLRV